MGKWCVIWSMLVGLGLGGVSCVRSEAPIPSSANPGCVWVVESASAKLYLCGTIHLLRDKDYPLPASYSEAYAGSQRLLLELPPGSSKGPELGQLMSEAGIMRGERSLFDMIDADTAKAFRAWLAKRRLDEGRFKSYRPWFAALMIAATEYQAAGAEANRGVDVFFEAKAAKDGKPGDGLETVKQQIDLFGQLTEIQQAELLAQTLGEVDELSGQFEDMVAAWKQGDLAKLQTMLFEEAEKYPELMEMFLHRRNAAWVPELEKYLGGKENVMVLVGSGHLAGEKGLIELLRRRGYRARQLVNSKAR